MEFDFVKLPIFSIPVGIMKISGVQIGYGLEVPDKISLNVYLSGCKNNKLCDRDLCQNKDLHDFENGKPYTFSYWEIFPLISSNFIECICLLGGEPLDQNKEDLFHFLKGIKNEFSNIQIYAYTGYNYDINKKEIDNFAEYFGIKAIYVNEYKLENCNQYWVDYERNI